MTLRSFPTASPEGRVRSDLQLCPNSHLGADRNFGVRMKREGAPWSEPRLSAKSQQLCSRAHIDLTTGLPNLRGLVQELTGRFAKWKRCQTPLALMLLSIQNFTNLVVRFGDPAGAAVMRALAQAIVGTLRLEDFLARSGDGEFALIVENLPLLEVQATAGRLLKELPRNRIPFGGSLLHAELRLGLAELVDGETPTALLRRTCDALQSAKEAGHGSGYVHVGTECLPIDPLFSPQCASENVAEERRSCRRYPFEYVQFVGSYVEGHWPSEDKLHPVTCHDISAAGFSYRSAEPPQHESIVLVLGFAAQRKHMLAKIVRCQPLPDGERLLYHVGCQFVGRLR